LAPRLASTVIVMDSPHRGEAGATVVCALASRAEQANIAHASVTTVCDLVMVAP
jgi:hypothetical protein